MFKLFGAAFLGWALGANDAANVCGPAVASRVVRYRTAIILAAVGVLLGAVLAGSKPMQSIEGLAAQTLNTAFRVSVSAALAMTLLIALRLPASSSQAVLGAIVAASWSRGQSVDAEILGRCVGGWLLTPVIAMVVGFVAYGLLQLYINRRRGYSLMALDNTTRWGLWIMSLSSAFALGANNAANVTGVFVSSGTLHIWEASLLAGASIGLGMLMFGHRMMFLVSRRLVRLEPPAALIAMLGLAVTVQLFAFWGIPVSSSQALAGSALGVGLYKGVRTIDRRAFLHVLLGWVATPLMGFSVALAAFQIG